jgi:alpha-L-fucosidase
MRLIAKKIVWGVMLYGLTAGCLAEQKYDPTWESLKTAPVPEWIMDAKFGIYTHWGVYSVPAYQTNIYGQEMYTSWENDAKARGIRKYHEANYGSIFEFGYKDFVPMFTAPKFDAAEWVDVMEAGGVRFAGLCLVHHDGFCLWDSQFTRWDSKDRGPKRDIYGEIAAEIRKRRGINLLATFHHARTYDHHLSRARDAGFTEEQKKKLDIYDPQYNDLYRNADTVSKELFGTEWQNKINEVIDKYQPDAIWFDGLSRQIKQGIIEEDKLLSCISNYYNKGTPYVDHPVIMNKLPSGKVWNFPVGFGLRCYENGRDMEKDVRGDWLIDRAIGYPWTWVNNKQYPQDASYHIVSIVDISARGGIMLLSLTPKGDGSIPAEEVRIMREIGDWLKINGEGIYATRPWKKVAEGIDVDQIRTVGYNPKRKEESASWNFEDLEAGKGQAVRFTRSKDYKHLYAFVIGIPESGQVTIQTLRKGNVAKNGSGIQSVDILGSDTTIDWKQTQEGLTITFPGKLPCDVAYGFKITPKDGTIDDAPRELLDDPIKRKGDWPVFKSVR